MSLLFWGLTLGIIGKVLLAVTVILVHRKITIEHKIDGIVLMEMKKESAIALLGLVLMVVGYLLEISFYGFIPGIAASTLL